MTGLTGRRWDGDEGSPRDTQRDAHGAHHRDPRADETPLARRLTRALHAEADGAAVPPDAWETFLARTGSPGGVAARRRPRTPALRPGATAARWRFPLVAAAAVAAIAVAAAAIVTGGFGVASPAPAAGSGQSGGAVGHLGGSSPTDPNSPASTASAANTTGATDTSGATGASATARARTCPQAPAAAVAVPVANASSTGSITLRMGFAPGSPPAVALCGSIGSSDPRAGGDAVTSDGTALGYLSLSRSTAAGATYLWGAVGPEVALVQVTTVLAPTAEDPHPSFALATQWIFGPARDATTAGRSSAEPGAVGWTDLGSGWHGIALRLPAHTQIVTAAAIDASGSTVESRNIDAATGHVSTARSRAASVAATAPPTTGPTGTLVVPASDDPCATVPDGRGEIRADDEGTPVLAHLDEAGTGLCFSEGSDWYTAQPTTGSGSELLRFFGVTGAEPGGGPSGATRLVVGLIGSAAAQVSATGDIEQVGPLHPLPGTDLRLVVLRASPGPGSVTVRGTTGHQVTRPVHSLG